MNPNYFVIAASKTRHPEALALLEALAAQAQALREAEQALPARINAHKAARGEPPVQLSAGEQAQLAGYTADQEALEAELSRDFAGMSSAGEIIWALHYGLSADLPQARALLAHYHVDDRALGEEIVQLKARLLAGFGEFLSQFPPA